MESVQRLPTASLTRSISTVSVALAVTSLAAAGIHFAVMGEHFEEYFPFGVFFSVVAWLQALWALGVVANPTRSMLLAGLIGNGLVIAVWLISRTSGLPIGPEPGTAEPAAFLDVLSTILEAGIVVTTGALLLQRRPLRSTGGGAAATLAMSVFALALIVLTSAAVASSDHGHADEAPGVGKQAEADGSGLSRVDLGGGRTLLAVVEESGGLTQMHLTFFDADGGELDVGSLSVSGVSPSGEEVAIPVQRFEPGQFAASLDLEGSDWEVHVTGEATPGGTFSASFLTVLP